MEWSDKMFRVYYGPMMYQNYLLRYILYIRKYTNGLTKCDHNRTNERIDKKRKYKL